MKTIPTSLTAASARALRGTIRQIAVQLASVDEELKTNPQASNTIGALVRSLRKQVESLKQQLPEYKLEYDRDARTSFFATLTENLNEMGAGPSFVFCKQNFTQDYFDESDTPSFDRELKEYLRNRFPESAINIWKMP